MEDIRNIHQVANKNFSSLFGTQSVKTYDVMQSALGKLGLSDIQFEGLEENYERLRNFGKVSPQIRGPEGSLTVDVPGKGDCWLTSLLAPLLGKVIDVADSGTGVAKCIH